jgi:hypothetical protein
MREFAMKTSKDKAFMFLKDLPVQRQKDMLAQLPPKAERTEGHYALLLQQLVEAKILKLLAPHPTGFTAPYIDRYLGNLGADDATMTNPLYTWKEWGDLQGLGMVTYDALCSLRKSGQLSQQHNALYTLCESVDSAPEPSVSIEGLPSQIEPLGAVDKSEPEPTYKERVSALCKELGLTRDDKVAWIKRLGVPKKAQRTDAHFKILYEALLSEAEEQA